MNLDSLMLGAELAKISERLDRIDATLTTRSLEPLTLVGPHRCPVCTGTGKVSRPPWLPGDLPAEHGYSTSNTMSYQCNACLGRGIVWAPTSGGPEHA